MRAAQPGVKVFLLASVNLTSKVAMNPGRNESLGGRLKNRSNHERSGNELSDG